MKTITANGETLEKSISNLFEEIKEKEIICVTVHSSKSNNLFYSNLFYIEQRPKYKFKKIEDFYKQIERMHGFTFSNLSIN